MPALNPQRRAAAKPTADTPPTSRSRRTGLKAAHGAKGPVCQRRFKTPRVLFPAVTERAALAGSGVDEETDDCMPSGCSSAWLIVSAYGLPDTLVMMRPSSANPRFEYSMAVSGVRANGTPSRSSRENSGSGNGVCRSPQGSSVTNPAVWFSRSRTRILGESCVGYFEPGSSGICSAGASRRSLPSSRSFRTVRAVKAFVIEAMRNSVSAVTGRFDSRSWHADPAYVYQPAVGDDSVDEAWDVGIEVVVGEDAVDGREHLGVRVAGAAAA